MKKHVAWMIAVSLCMGTLLAAPEEDDDDDRASGPPCPDNAAMCPGPGGDKFMPPPGREGDEDFDAPRGPRHGGPMGGNRGGGRFQKGGMGGNREMMGMGMLMKLKIENPAKFAELKALKAKDPKKFEQEVQALHEQFMKAKKQEHDAIRALVDNYRETKDAKVKEQLREKLQSSFDERMKNAEQCLKEQEKRLEEAKKNLEARKANAGAIIDGRLENMLRDPELRW